jgi:hypothetical protein
MENLSEGNDEREMLKEIAYLLFATTAKATWTPEFRERWEFWNRWMDSLARRRNPESPVSARVENDPLSAQFELSLGGASH